MRNAHIENNLLFNRTVTENRHRHWRRTLLIVGSYKINFPLSAWNQSSIIDDVYVNPFLTCQLRHWPTNSLLENWLISLYTRCSWLPQTIRRSPHVSKYGLGYFFSPPDIPRCEINQNPYQRTCTPYYAAQIDRQQVICLADVRTDVSAWARV